MPPPPSHNNQPQKDLEDILREQLKVENFFDFGGNELDKHVIQVEHKLKSFSEYINSTRFVCVFCLCECVRVYVCELLCKKLSVAKAAVALQHTHSTHTHTQTHTHTYTHSYTRTHSHTYTYTHLSVYVEELRLAVMGHQLNLTFYNSTIDEIIRSISPATFNYSVARVHTVREDGRESLCVCVYSVCRWFTRVMFEVLGRQGSRTSPAVSHSLIHACTPHSLCVYTPTLSSSCSGTGAVQ